MQGPKYATVSDIVVYGENGVDEAVVETAIQIKEAQEVEWYKRHQRGIRYNVFVVSGECAIARMH